jgi:hypothetical protein
MAGFSASLDFYASCCGSKEKEQLGSSHRFSSRSSAANKIMPKLKEINRTATMAWFSSSHTHLPMIATGTVAGAMDASFSNDADLELFTVDLDSQELELQPSAKISCTSR